MANLTGGGAGGNLGLIDRILYQLRIGNDPITAVMNGVIWWVQDWSAAHPDDNIPYF